MMPGVPEGWKGCWIPDVEAAGATLPEFLATPGKHVVFWSPAVELVIWDPWMAMGIDWLVVAGEAGRDARPFCQDWLRTAIKSGSRRNVPVFIAQMGSNCVTHFGNRICHRHYSGGKITEWAPEYRVRQYPSLPSA